MQEEASRILTSFSINMLSSNSSRTIHNVRNRQLNTNENREIIAASADKVALDKNGSSYIRKSSWTLSLHTYTEV